MIVSDANLIVYLLTPFSNVAEEARAVLRTDPDWRVPALWRSEFRSVLWTMMRRGTLSLPDALTVMDKAEATIQDVAGPVSSEAVLRLAAESGCSPYDCEFAALALQLGCALVTSDRALLKAFPGFALSPREFIRARS